MDRGPSGYRRYWAGGGQRKSERSEAVSLVGKKSESQGDGNVAVKGDTSGVDTMGGGVKDELLSSRAVRYSKDDSASPT